MMDSIISIGWRPSSFFGWGVFGLNLALELEAGSGPKPLITGRLARDDVIIDGLRASVLAKTFARSEAYQAKHARKPPKGVPHLVPLSGSLAEDAPTKHSVGFVFLESTALTEAGLARAARFRRILAGSRWNTEVLRARGLERVVTVLQGVDTSLFCPGPRRGFFRDRFVVFSGGKLEYRKGQDIVLAAFKAFHQRHREAMLAFCWSNPFPQSVSSIACGPHGTGIPTIGASGHPDLSNWVQRNGIPPSAFVNLGFVPNPLMPGLLREVDLAVFPNRCEGGTNLVAMEAMACGVPVALSANTGHLDVLAEGTAYPLTSQGACVGAPAELGTEGWGETDVEELLEAMETAYQDRADARRRGEAAREAMQQLTWATQTAEILAAVGS